ncbi:MAG: hypothetical protein LBK99_25520 [Opitutaceae bacterium]|jgi:hypothetical protein|nr:hypothetical protein [Opitutaceae bacterium]
MKRITHIITSILALAVTGCTTVNTTSSDGATTTTRELDWNTINHMGKLAVKYATKAILDNNPGYAPSIEAVSAGLYGILSGEPSDENIGAGIAEIAPDIPPGDVATLAAAIKDGVDLYLAKSGHSVILDDNGRVQALISALSEGIKEGITLHKAATRS